VIDRLKVRLPKFDAPVALMSGGQRQAIAVARATVFARKVVILDEPTAALGVRESRKVLDLIASFAPRATRSSSSPTTWNTSSNLPTAPSCCARAARSAS
jgi:ABC-type sugar transport system ATPase subunit